MAIYHLQIKIISRGNGKSAVAAAAYRAGETITNERDGITHDYTSKGGIVHTEILLPENAPSEYADRAVLWNAVEKIERAKNSQLARELEIALPAELSLLQNKVLVRDYVKTHFVDKGMCADICIHDTGSGNPHAHIMLTMRPFNEDKSWGDKQKKVYYFDDDGNKIYDPIKRQYKCNKVQTTDWNEHTKAEEWRAAWADMCNQYLERNNVTERIDHRSYERQGIEQIPTVHLGVAAFQMEKRGIRTERGDINREIEVTNSQIRQLKARISKLRDWLKEETENIKPPTLADVFEAMLNKKQQQGRYKQIADLKTAAKTLVFLQENNIMDMARLQEKVSQIYSRHGKVGSRLNAIEKRLKVLSEHIRHSENYFNHREVYRTYKQQKPNKRDAYYESHRADITLYEAAERYLKPVMNGRTTIPTYSWKEELKKLAAEKNSLYQEYYKLKDEVKEVEIIKSNVEDIMREESRETQRTRAQGHKGTRAQGHKGTRAQGHKGTRHGVIIIETAGVKSPAVSLFYREFCKTRSMTIPIKKWGVVRFSV